MPKLLVTAPTFTLCAKTNDRLLHEADTEVDLDAESAEALVKAGRALYLHADDVPSDLKPAFKRFTAAGVIQQAAAVRRRALARRRATSS